MLNKIVFELMNILDDILNKIKDQNSILYNYKR